MGLEKHQDLHEFLQQEFACWWSSCKVTKNQKSMPQELPTPLEGQVPLQKNLSTTHATVPVSSTSSIIAKSTVLTSVCETVLSQASSLTSNVKSTGSIDIVVVPNLPFSTTAQIVTSTTTTTQASSQYRLSEIILQEKDNLFKKDADQDVELEPMREETLTVRRRSRQFFTVMEEDENESNDTHSLAGSVSGGANKKEKVLEVEPVFNLGDSLRYLYFPDQHGKKSKRRKDHILKKSNDRHRHGYQSDPEGKVDLCKIIKQDPELGKRYQSHPDLPYDDRNMLFVDDYMESRISKSLPTTPKVSPKLKRRNSLTKEHETEVQKSGPGFSFLESVAGQLHRKKIEHGKKLEQGLVKVSDVDVRRPAEIQVAQPETFVVVTQKEPTTTIHTHHLHDFSDSAGSDLDSDRPVFMKTFLTWSTTQKVNISNKESNMFSPSSF